MIEQLQAEHQRKGRGIAEQRGDRIADPLLQTRPPWHLFLAEIRLNSSESRCAPVAVIQSDPTRSLRKFPA